MADIRVQDEQGNIHVFPDGSTPEMIAKVMNVKPPSSPAQPQEQPGFLKRLGQSLGVPTSMDELQAMGLAEANKSLGQSFLEAIPGGRAIPMVKNVAQTAYKGIKEGAQEAQEAGEQLGSGQITPGQFAGKFGYGMLHAGLQATPIIGPSIETAGEDIAHNNYSGAAGGLTGVIGQVAAPELAKRGGALLERASGTAAERMYQSALKPSTAKFAPNPEQVVKTGLNAGVPVSEAGQAKLEGLIQDLSDTIQGKIQSGSRAGATIDTADIANRLDALKSKFSKQALPAEDLQTIEDAKQAFLKAHPPSMALSEAQEMKQGTYQQLKGKYGQLSSARIEAEKALARGAKEELETQFPEIKGLNAQEGQLINLDGALEKAVRRIGNHQLIGIGTPIVAGAVGGTAGGPAGIAAGVMKALVDDPIVKSKLAIALNKAGRGAIPMSAAGGQVLRYSKALEQPQSENEER